MPDAPLPPAPPEPPPRPPALRPPPPGPVVWVAFLLGPSFVLACGCVLALLAKSKSPPGAEAFLGVAIGGAAAGMVIGMRLVGGLALATRFCDGLVGRIMGGFLIGLTLLIGLAGVAFAGCMCMIGGGKMFG